MILQPHWRRGRPEPLNLTTLLYNFEFFVEKVRKKGKIAGIHNGTTKYAKEMINQDKRVNGEFYVCPVFNEAIEDNKKIKIFPIQKMWGLGTPEDLQIFLDRGQK